MRNLFAEPEDTPMVFRFDGNTVWFSDDAGERRYVDTTFRSSAHGFVLDGIRKLRETFEPTYTIIVQDPSGEYARWMKRRAKTANIPLHVY